MCVGGGGGGRDWGNPLKLKLSLMSDLTSIFFSGPPTQPENLLKLKWNFSKITKLLLHLNSLDFGGGGGGGLGV